MGGPRFLPERYKPLRLLGEGGAGRVWLCEDSLRGRERVAVKVLAPGGNEILFRKEFATLATLAHPNIPEIYSFGELIHGSCFFSLEYIDGISLADAILEQPEEFESLVAEALLALSFIHDFGLIHRDVKPQNLLVRREPRNGWRMVLLDFGLAESRRASDAEAGGTLRYMAPELLEGSSPGIRTDLYALGVVLMEALVGGPILDIDPAEDLVSYLSATKTPIASNRVPNFVSEGLLKWLNNLRDHDPDSRPIDSREALAQLGTVVGSSIGLESETTRAARIASGSPPGRSDVLEEILEALENPDTVAVLLTGEAGAGKSRILDTIRASAVEYGWRIGSASDWSPRANSESLGDSISFVPIDELENASPEVGSHLDYLVRRLSKKKTIKILACGREEEITDPRIRSLLSDIDLIPTAKRIQLKPLGRAGVGEVLERAYGGDPSQARVDEILAATNGLAASIEALVVSGDTTAGGTSRLRESIAKRLDHAPEPAQRCAAALAAVGEPLSVTLLRLILSTDESILLDSLESLKSLKLARQIDGRWQLVSRFVARTVLSCSNHETLNQVARQAVCAIEGDAGPASDAKLSRLWRQLGDSSTAARYATRAADRAFAGEEFHLAAAWYRRAMLDLPKHDPGYGNLRKCHARAAENAGDFGKAARSYAAYLRTIKNDASRSRFLIKQARSFLKSGRPKKALRVANDARAEAQDDRHRHLADAVLGAALIYQGELERACELLTRAGPCLAELGEHLAAAEAFYATGLARERRREPGAAAAAYRSSTAYAKKHRLHEVQVNSLISASIVDSTLSKPGRALRRLEEAREIATEHQLERQLMWITANTARSYSVMGMYDKALTCLEETKTRSRLLGNRHQYMNSSVTSAETLITLGRPAQARVVLQGVVNGNAEPLTKKYARITLLEAMNADPDVDEAETVRALDGLLRHDAKTRLDAWGCMIVTLETHARLGTQPPARLWEEFQGSLGEEGLERSLKARGWLARSKEKIRCGEGPAALDACSKALEALAGRHHDLAAQVHLSMSKAHRLAGKTVEANLTLERGREELDTAGNLIEDEELRNDFLARPVFKELRKRRESFADAEERLDALYDMVHALNTGDDPEGRLGVILDQALRVVRAERGLILLRSEGDDRYRVRLARNLEADTVEEAAQFSRTAVLAAGKGEPVLAINTANDERLREMKSVSAYGIKSLLCVPLRLRDELVGAVYADSRADGALFSQRDLAFLEAFADHAALALENARDLRRLEQRKAQLLSASEAREGLGEIVGSSPGMQKVYDMIERVAESDLPVLIQGDSGTGKELVAREIYRRSLRTGRPFLTENCAAIADSLLESELFGHVKGAFTGADRDKAGLFEQADGGTLFLDEVGDMSAAMQARLLRVLQDGDLRRVGGEASTEVDVRLISATHRDLSRRVAEGEFREDLLYRLQVLVIQLPPLKDRPADIEQLVDHFLERIARQRDRGRIAIRRDAMELLERYAWPGNVRQLENTLQRLALLAGTEAIDRSTVEQDPSLAAALIGQRATPSLSLKQNERDRIEEALRRAGGNRNAAARLLGVSRATIFRKIKQHGLS